MTLGLGINGRFKAYRFKELNKGATRFKDEFNGVAFVVVYDKRYNTARIIDADEKEIPSTLAFWFAWYAFHPDTEIYRH
jgi:hypothetical protein